MKNEPDEKGDQPDALQPPLLLQPRDFAYEKPAGTHRLCLRFTDRPQLAQSRRWR